jgi:hypothetical protein
MQSSRLAEGFHPGVDVVNCRLEHGILVGDLRMWDGRGCQAFDVDSFPDVSGLEGKGVMAEDNVKGGDCQMADRMALSARNEKQRSCSLSR